MRIFANGIEQSPAPHKHHVNMRIATPATTQIVDAETWYDLQGIYDNGLCDGFDVSEDGIITYKGQTKNFFFGGQSSLEVDKACLITYQLEVNDVAMGAITTPRSFSAPSKIGSIGIVRNVTLNYNDKVRVVVKSDTAITDLIAQVLYIVINEI